MRILVSTVLAFAALSGAVASAVQTVEPVVTQSCPNALRVVDHTYCRDAQGRVTRVVFTP